MVKIINPIWDQTPKSARKPVAVLIRDDGPMLKTSAQRRQEAEAAAEKQKVEAARFAEIAAQKRSEWEAAANAGPASPHGAIASSHAAEASHAATAPSHAATAPSHVAEASPFTSESPETCLSPAAVTQPKSASVPEEADLQEAKPQPKTGVAAGTPHVPKQKVPRRLGDLPPERRSIRAGYNLVRVCVTPKGPGLQDPGSQDRFKTVSKHSITAPPRPQIVVCLQYPLPETGTGQTQGAGTKKPRLAESAEARAAYLGEAIHFAEPLSISVAAVAGSAEAETMTKADTLTVVLMPTRYAPRVPKLSHIIALALSAGLPQERSPQASETTRDEESPQKEEPLGALELTKLRETGADVFLFAPHPFLTSPLFRGPDPARRPPGREFDCLPECPVPGEIRLLIPEIAVTSKSIQRRLDAFLVDLSAGVPQGDLPALPASYLTEATDFDWGALLKADPVAYKKAAAKQARNVLLHLLSLQKATETE